MGDRWTFSTTGYTFVGTSHEYIREICVSAGFSGIEGADKLFVDCGETDLARIRQEYERAGLSINSYHLPFESHHDIASFYETVRRAAVETMVRHMECAAALGARVVIQHPTTSRFDVAVEGFESYLRQLDRSFRTLLPRAETLGLTVAVENMLPGSDGDRVGSRPEHFTAFSKSFGHRCFGYCLDTGHALVAGGPEGAHEFLDAMGESVAAFHLADNAGDRDSHLAPGRGLVDWDRVFRRVADLGFAHPMCVETPPFAHSEDGRFAPDSWKALADDTRALAERAVRG